MATIHRSGVLLGGPRNCLNATQQLKSLGWPARLVLANLSDPANLGPTPFGRNLIYARKDWAVPAGTLQVWVCQGLVCDGEAERLLWAQLMAGIGAELVT